MDEEVNFICEVNWYYYSSLSGTKFQDFNYALEFQGPVSLCIERKREVSLLILRGH